MIRRGGFTLAAICAGISLFAFSVPVAAQMPAQTTAQPAQLTGTLPGGGTYVVRTQSNSATAAIELWFRAPGAGYDLATPGISRLAIAAVAASSAPHSTSISEMVRSMGGTLSLEVYPDIAMIGAGVPAWQARNVLRAMTSAYFKPAISDDGYKEALRDCAIAAAESQFSAERTLQDTLFAHLFTGGPAHYPPIPGAAQDYTKIPLDGVKAFAARAFRQQNAVLALTGAVDPAWLTSLVPAVQGGASGQDAPFDSPVTDRGADVSQTAAVGGLGFAWAGPPISDVKAATALDFVADYLFDPEHGTVTQAASAGTTDTFVNGQFITLHDPGVMLVTVSGSYPASTRGKIAGAIGAMQKPLDAKTFEAARNAFIYHIFSQVQTPLSRADNFGWYAAEGNLPYAPGDSSGAYLAAARSLDPDYVAQVVRRYLQHPAIVELSTGHAQGTAS